MLNASVYHINKKKTSYELNLNISYRKSKKQRLHTNIYKYAITARITSYRRHVVSVATRLQVSHVPGGMPKGGGLISEPPMNVGCPGSIVGLMGAMIGMLVTGAPESAMLIGGPARTGNRCIMAELKASCCLAWLTAACCAADTAIASCKLTFSTINMWFCAIWREKEKMMRIGGVRDRDKEVRHDRNTR